MPVKPDAVRTPSGGSPAPDGMARPSELRDGDLAAGFGFHGEEAALSCNLSGTTFLCFMRERRPLPLKPKAYLLVRFVALG